MKATMFYALRRPLVRNCNGRPFVWFNSEKHRIEISHGTKLTIIQLTSSAYPRRVFWEKQYRQLPEEYIHDMDGRTVASWVGGDEQMDFDLIVIRHSRQITCFAIPKGRVFQIQHETLKRPM